MRSPWRRWARTPRAKIAAFVLAAALAAVAGALFVGYRRCVDPLSFTLGESIFLMAMVVLGGTGNHVGPPMAPCW